MPSPSNDMQFPQTVRLVRVLRVVRVMDLYIRLSPSDDMQFRQTVRLVNHCFTTRMSCTGRTSRGLVYTPKSL